MTNTMIGFRCDRKLLSASFRVLSFLCVLLASAPKLFADNYDSARTQWVAMQVGASNNTGDANIAASVTTTATNANTYWSSMATGSTRTYLWSDLSDFTNSANITNSYGRLETMAAAYAQPGNSLQGSTSLATAIIGGLDWMYTNYYNATATMYGNWYDWEIGSAQASMTTALLVYGQLSSTEIANYTATVAHFDPNPSYWYTIAGVAELNTGANLTDVCLAVILSGILSKNSTPITTAETDLAPVFLYVTSGDGFYADGSFIQHTHVAYTSHYGEVLLGDVANLFLLLNTSAWPITDSNASNVWNWAVQSYAPLIYNGAIGDTANGRVNAVCSSWDHANGRTAIVDLLRLSSSLTSSQAGYLQGLIKTWVTNDTTWSGYTNPCNGPGSTATLPVSTTYSSIYTNLSPYDIANLESVMSNTAITAEPQLTGNFYFPSMQRVVQALPGYTFNLSLFSNGVSSFECGNGTNVKGWYAGLGMNYLNNGDLEQYDNNYWATINMTRLPGVTTDNSTKTPSCTFESYLNTHPWVGGSTVDGLYGSTGMQFTLVPITGSTLNGQKSWFWFGNKMVALGAGITSTSSGAVETIVENRKLDAAGDNALVVGGVSEPTTTGWSATLLNTSWAYLDGGGVANAGIGYYFPGLASLSALRETRTGAWSTVQPGTSTAVAGPSTSYTDNFLSLAFEHGTTPSNGTYAYAVLPNQTASTMASYAASPDFIVLDNTTSLQAVVDTGLNAVGANFWGNTSTTLNDKAGLPFITSQQNASVTTLEGSNELDLGVSDPTQANTGTVNLTINRSASSVISSSPQVTVTQLTPTINLAVNVNAAAGKSFSAKFVENAIPSLASAGDGADSYVQNGTYGNTNYGTAPTLYVKNDTAGYYRTAYLQFNTSSIVGAINNATVTLVPTNEGASGITNAAYTVSSNSWTATGITWNNAPAIGAQITSWTVPAVGTPITFNVTSQAAAAQQNGNVFTIAIQEPTDAGTADWVEYASSKNATTSYRPSLTASSSGAWSLGDVANSYVRDGSYAATNYGGGTYLYVKNDGVGYDRTSYLQFNLAGISGTISSAKVYLVPVAEGQSGIANQAYLVTDNTWTETGITWNNAPSLSTTLLGSWTVPSVGTQVAFDVTAAAAAAQSTGNLLSIGITSTTETSDGWVEYGSKENATTGYQPVIVISIQ